MATPNTSVAEVPNSEDGVWEVDVEIAFNEAIELYPPCGRRKIVDQAKGKMYGKKPFSHRPCLDSLSLSYTRSRIL